MLRPDVLIITALQDELEAVLALGESGRQGWRDARDRGGFHYYVREMVNTSGEPILVTTAWAGDMGEVAAATRAQRLVDELDPTCLAMCGICAGRRGDVALGDVIIADRVYSYDHGKLTAEAGGGPGALSQDITTYNLEATWKMEAADFARQLDAEKKALTGDRPPSLGSQRQWLLRTQYAHERKKGPSPKEHPDRGDRCPSWSTIVERALEEGLIRIDNAREDLVLTEKGHDLTVREHVLRPHDNPDPQIRVLLGTIATGKTVREDPQLFDRLRQSVRKTIGVEMEAAGIGYVAALLGRRSIVVKAVSDHGDHEKDDRFRAFACRASAEILLAFLLRYLQPSSRANVPAPRQSAAQQRQLDLALYTKMQLGRLDTDHRYPSDIYIEQRAKWRITRQPWKRTPNVLEEITSVLDSADGRLLVVLGDSGTGKTFLMREICRRLSTVGGPKPVLVELGMLDQRRTLNELLRLHFAAVEFGQIDLGGFLNMLDDGKVVLLFDGFDELALRVSYDQVLEDFGTVLSAASNRAKVVITSRTAHFLTDRDVNKELADRMEKFGHARLFKLEPFSDDQIRRFLGKLLDDEEQASARFDLLREVKDLRGLSENPRMLSFIAADLSEDDLRNAMAPDGRITSAVLYGALINKWLEEEVNRARESGTPTDLDVDQLSKAVKGLARELWFQAGGSLRIDRIPRELIPAMDPSESRRSLHDRRVQHQLGARSLLVRDEDANFSFLHQSLMEWLVAAAAVDEVKATADSTVLNQREMSDLMADFFVALAGPEVAVRWVKAKQGTRGSEIAANNALRVRDRLANDSRFALEVTEDFARRDLRGKDFTKRNLQRANLVLANLSGVTLSEANLSGAHLMGASLVNANLTRARLIGADLTRANLTSARLIHADLEGANLTEATLRRAKLLGARLPDLKTCDTFGAAQGTTPPKPMWMLSSEALAVTFSPNGELIASGHGDGTVRLWDATAGSALRTLLGHGEGVRAVAFSKDGKTLASGSDDKTVRLWQLDTGTATPPLQGHRDRVLTLSFSGDGKVLASGSQDKTIRLWFLDTAEVLATLRGHAQAVRTVVFSGDGRTLASGSDDMSVRLWDQRKHTQLRMLLGHAGPVQSVHFSADGQMLASGSDDKTVRLWEPDTGTMIRKLAGHTQAVTSVAFVDRGRSLLSGSKDKTLRLWDVSEGRSRQVLEGHTDWVRSVSSSRNGKAFASASDDKTIRLWHMDANQRASVLKGHADWVTSVTWSSHDQALASGSEDKKVRLWHAGTCRQVRVLEGHAAPVTCVAMSRDGPILASGSSDKTIRLWNTATDKPIPPLKGHTSSVTSVAFTSDGRTLASGSFDETVRLWDTVTGKPTGSLQGHHAYVLSVAFSIDGQMLASGSFDNTVRLWDVASRKLVNVFQGHTGRVCSVAFADEGQILASGSSDTTIRLWDIRGNKSGRVLKGHTDHVLSVALAHGGQLLASASLDKTVRLWRGSEVAGVLKGHGGGVFSVAFSPDGQMLASASMDGTLRLWEIATCRCLAIFLPLPEGWAAFTPEGRYKLGGNADGFWHVVNLCRFEPGELDPYLPGLRLDDDTPLFPSFPGRWFR